jgi:hypothetical protein
VRGNSRESLRGPHERTENIVIVLKIVVRPHLIVLESPTPLHPLVVTDPLVGTDLPLVGTDLPLVGTDLPLVVTDLPLVGRDPPPIPIVVRNQVIVIASPPVGVIVI